MVSFHIKNFFDGKPRSFGTLTEYSVSHIANFAKATHLNKRIKQYEDM